MLQTDGFPLSHSQCAMLSLARAIADAPSLLLVDGSLDELEPGLCDRVWGYLAKLPSPWTIVLVSERPELIALCPQCLDLFTREDQD